MSSASYHMFALFMDTGLLPFYLFIAIFANNNYLMAPDMKGRWTSFFTQQGATSTLLFATFIGACVMTGLHVVSGCIDICLIVLFRKIANLPPDMNPLEDNLTSRKTSKHKHKNSEFTLTDSLAEKKPAYLSGITLSVDQGSRLSTATKENHDVRQVPFRHSRMDSEAMFSPHNPESARWSRQQFEDVNLYAQPASAQGSRNDVNGHARGNSMSPSKHGSYVDINETLSTPTRVSRPVSYPTSRPGTDVSGNSARYSSPALPNAAPSNALVKSQQKEGLLNNNWYVLDDDEADLGTPSRQHAPASEYPNPPRSAGGLTQISRHDSFDPQPLKSHPPTPPMTSIAYSPEERRTKRSALTDRRDNGNGIGDLDRGLTVTSNVTATSSVYSESAPSLNSSKAHIPSQTNNGTPKSKYYGDLSAATRGIRGTFASSETLKSNATLGAAAADATGMSALGSYGYVPDPPPKPKRGYESSSPRKDRGARVVSRTGADVGSAQAVYPSDAGVGMRGRRDVSGKIAEEGRGGGRWWMGRGY